MQNFRFSILSENLVCKQPFRAEHGLSVMIESDSRIVLFDTGGSDLFLHNSRALDIELFGVDDIIISHGHYDHSSGLPAALKETSRARVHIHEQAFKHKLSASTGKLRYIGLPDEVRATLVEADKREELAIMKGSIEQLDFSFKLFCAGGRQHLPDDWTFYIGDESGSEAIPDRFEDEISLLIEGDKSSCLLTGCSHCGIDNIYAKALELTEKPLRHIIGGSHLSAAPEEEVARIADFFSPLDVQLHLGHCTGINGYARLYSRLKGRQIQPIHAGMQMTLTL
ncbi:MAG: MBL fold metallo-hydrolase [Victivallales bacterium]|nr:MBL fold metallo-hydrolase [Victivallales bacterium]